MKRRDFASGVAVLGLGGWSWAAHALSLSDADAVSGLRAALERGAGSAVSLLGRTDGFLGNPQVRIPLPEWLEKSAGLLRAAGQGHRVVFGVILGTGTGGGIVVRGQVVTGAHAIAGEWGHNPLPWPDTDELPGPACYCGRFGCLETWLSGPGIAADYRRHGGEALTSEEIAARIADDPLARETMRAWTRRLAAQKHIPLGRLGLPEEAARAILFLASPLSSYTTGSHIDISGGHSRHA